eukprot:365151-Chlamydomonas_euryale.AAC.3
MFVKYWADLVAEISKVRPAAWRKCGVTEASSCVCECMAPYAGSSHTHWRSCHEGPQKLP